MASVFIRLTRSRKDGKEITFTDYKGETRTSKHEPIGVIFRQDNGMLSLKYENTDAPDNDKFWYNAFENDRQQGGGGGRAKSGGKARGKRADTRDVPEDDDIPF